MKRVLMSSAEFGLATRPTHIEGSSRCAATMQMPITPGSSANTASLSTSAMRSAMPQSSGCQCQKSFTPVKKAREKIQFATRTMMKGR